MLNNVITQISVQRYEKKYKRATFLAFFLHFRIFFVPLQAKMDNKMRKIIIFGLVCVLCASCGPHKPTVAELRAQKHVKDSIGLVQQEQTMAYADSLLQLQMPIADSLLPRFKYVKNDRYEDHGHYICRDLEAGGLGQRIFLQAYVTDDMKTVVRSFYYGDRKLEHETIILSADEVTNTFSGHCHTYNAEGNHEIMTLNDEDAVNLLKFVAAYADSPIKITLCGKSKYTYIIKDKEKAALIETLRLQTVMSDIKKLESQYRQASLQVEKYKKRLEK